MSYMRRRLNATLLKLAEEVPSLESPAESPSGRRCRAQSRGSRGSRLNPLRTRKETPAEDNAPRRRDSSLHELVNKYNTQKGYTRKPSEREEMRARAAELVQEARAQVKPRLNSDPIPSSHAYGLEGPVPPRALSRLRLTSKASFAQTQQCKRSHSTRIEAKFEKIFHPRGPVTQHLKLDLIPMHPTLYA